MTTPAATAINVGTGYRKVSTATAAIPIQRVLEKSIANTLTAIKVETIGSIDLHWKYLGKVGRYWVGIAPPGNTQCRLPLCMTRGKREGPADSNSDEQLQAFFDLLFRVNVFDLGGASNAGADSIKVLTPAINTAGSRAS